MSFTAAQLAEKIGATVRGEGAAVLHRCAGLEEAGEGEVSFLANRKYARLLAATFAAAQHPWSCVPIDAAGDAALGSARSDHR